MARRLLFVMNEAGYFLSHRLALARTAAAEGFEIHVATAPGPAQADIRRAGFITHDVPLTRSGLRPDREFYTALMLARLYREIRPDLVHLVAMKAVALGLVAARLVPVPALVMTIAGLGHIFLAGGWGGRVLRGIFTSMLLLLVPRRSRIIMQNPDDIDRLATTRYLRARTVLIRGSGVDLDRYRPAPEPGGPVSVLFPARMLWTKGAGEFVAAARMLAAQGVKARFLMAGDTDPGNPSAVPRDELVAWHAEGVIEWLGFRNDIPALMAASHVVCLPSYREGLPKSLIEAAAAGRPIITTDVPGCREIVRDGENGLLVPVRDTSALAAAMARMIHDPDLRARMGARGREMAVAGYGDGRVSADTMTVYRALLA